MSRPIFCFFHERQTLDRFYQKTKNNQLQQFNFFSSLILLLHQKWNCLKTSLGGTFEKWSKNKDFLHICGKITKIKMHNKVSSFMLILMYKRNSISRFLQKSKKALIAKNAKTCTQITRSPKAFPLGSTRDWLVMHKWYHLLNIVCSKFKICDFSLTQRNKMIIFLQRRFESIFPSRSRCWSACKMIPDGIFNELIQLVNVTLLQTGVDVCEWVNI